MTPFHRALRADRHERRRLDVAVRGRHAAAARAAVGVRHGRKLKTCEGATRTDHNGHESALSRTQAIRAFVSSVSTRGGETVKKLRVGVIYGGRSGEHEVSLASAAAVFKNLDPDRYEAVAIRIEKDGRWTLPAAPPTLISAADVIAAKSAESTGLVPGDAPREAHLVAHPGGDTLMTIDRARREPDRLRPRARRRLSRAARSVRRRRHGAGAARAGERPVRRRRRARLRGRHGQGGDEAGLRGEGAADLRLRGRA